MIDAITNKPLTLEAGGDAPGLLIVPESQLGQVRTLLDENRIRYWVDDEVLSVDDEPYVAFVNISSNSDPKLVQKLLDSIP